MRASDVVVTKAGSATLAEAFSQARPVVTYQALPGQEEGNVALLEREGLGRHVADMAVLPAAIARVYAEGTTCGTGERARWWADAAARVAGGLAVAARAIRLSSGHHHDHRRQRAAGHALIFRQLHVHAVDPVAGLA